jgi:serine/threonine-protein kinase
MGGVFVARLSGESRFVRLFAVKRIRADLAADVRFVDRFFDEARIAACIHSPHVVPVLDVGRDVDGTPFMLMELVFGVDLARLCSSESLPIEACLSILLDVARGLRDAHETTDPYGGRLDIAHRDITPRNILVGIDGRARITDFGIATARRREAVSAPGEVKGSYAYFSPEHLHGAADAQSDLFSFGILAWEILARRSLFSSGAALDVMHAVATAPVPSLIGIVPNLPPELDDIVARALRRDRTRRTRRARDLVEALERVPLQTASPDDVGRRVVEASGTLVDTLRALARSAGVDVREALERVDTLVDRSPPDFRSGSLSTTLPVRDEPTLPEDETPTRER